MPKKTLSNAFHCFMLDFQQKQREQGRRFPNGLADVSVAAAPVWNRMTSEEKAPFWNRSQQIKEAAKAAQPTAEAERYTTQGVPFSEVDRLRAQLHNEEARMRNDIQKVVTDSYENNTITTQEYIFVAGNYFCKTISNLFVPAELALVKYNLAEGYGQTYHTFINPMHLPSGYAFEAQEHSKKSHQIPPPPNAPGQPNYTIILKAVLQFFGTDTAKHFPPIYTNSDQVPVIKSILQQLCLESNTDPADFRVYPLAQLFYVLKEAACKYGLDEVEAFKSIHIAQAMIDRDQYDYRTNIACLFHQDSDCMKFCSLSQVIRWTFTFSDHICLDLGIDLIPGRHVPIESDVMTGLQLRDTNEFEEDASMVSVLEINDTASIATSYSQPNKRIVVDDDSISLVSDMISAVGISDVASIATSYKTNYTNPMKCIESDNVSLVSDASYATTITSEKAQAMEHSGAQPVEPENLWFRRNNSVARAPLDDSLVFPINRGRGRGSLLNDSMKLTQRIFGRGKVE